MRRRRVPRHLPGVTDRVDEPVVVDCVERRIGMIGNLSKASGQELERQGRQDAATFNRVIEGNGGGDIGTHQRLDRPKRADPRISASDIGGSQGLDCLLNG